jgi:hypothetical protein
VTNGSGHGSNKWNATKEKILLIAGLVCLGVYMGAFIFYDRKFPIEFLLLIAAMFGLSIAAWGDKK